MSEDDDASSVPLEPGNAAGDSCHNYPMRQTLLQHVQASVELKQSFFDREVDRIVAQADDMAERLRRGARILVLSLIHI